jgi:hypothetical protein
MWERVNRLREAHARDAARYKEELQAQFGDELFKSRAARLGLKGLQVSAMLRALAPVIGVVFMVCFTCVQTAFGQDVQIRGDSSKFGGMFITAIKWVAILVAVLSVGSIFWTIIQGISGNEWQGQAKWSLVGLCAGSIVGWAFDVADNKDPIFDHKKLGF